METFPTCYWVSPAYSVRIVVTECRSYFIITLYTPPIEKYISFHMFCTCLFFEKSVSTVPLVSIVTWFVQNTELYTTMENAMQYGNEQKKTTDRPTVVAAYNEYTPRRVVWAQSFFSCVSKFVARTTTKNCVSLFLLRMSCFYFSSFLRIRRKNPIAYTQAKLSHTNQ